MAKQLKHSERREELILGRFARMDWQLFLVVLILWGIGIAALFSAAQGDMQPWADSHLKRGILGFAALFTICILPIGLWFRYAYILYGFGIALLLLVEVMGYIGMGAQRWINIGGFNLQPSEFMKVALVLALARYFHNVHLNNIHKLTLLIAPAIIIAVPMLLILKQPNLGTASLIAMLGGAILFAAGVRIRLFIIAAVLVLSALPVVWHNMHDYQKRRVETFLDPEADPLGAGYNIMQSKIAFGSGGLSGKGFLQGSQSQLSFLPEKQTDFIFTMFAEEFGFMGAMLVIALFGALIFRGLAQGMNAHSQFAKIVAFGMVTIISLHVFINMAMTMGLIPVVGVPLPFLSFGGSNLLAMLIAIGFIQNVAVHGQNKLPRAVA